MPEPAVDPSALVIGRRYRVDRRHEGLRRTFRFTGTLVAIDSEPGAGTDDPPSIRLTFEEKPRFGPAVQQTHHLATLVAVTPA